MSGHIGIVACSGPGAALCYETICAEAPRRMGRYAHPEVSLHCPSFAAHVRCLDAGDWDGVAALLLASAHKLATIGAGFLICPDNTEASRAAVHAIIERLRVDDGCDAVVLGCTELPLLVLSERSPLPTLDSTRLLARAAIERALAGAPEVA